MDLPDEIHLSMVALDPPAQGEGVTFMLSEQETTRIREQLDQRVRDAEAAVRNTHRPPP